MSMIDMISPFYIDFLIKIAVKYLDWFYGLPKIDQLWIRYNELVRRYNQLVVEFDGLGLLEGMNIRNVVTLP